MYEKIYDAPLLQPNESRVPVHRPNRRDVSLACHRKVSLSVLDHEVTMADYSTVLERRQLPGPKLDVRQASTCSLSPNERQSAGGGDWYSL